MYRSRFISVIINECFGKRLNFQAWTAAIYRGEGLKDFHKLYGYFEYNSLFVV